MIPLHPSPRRQPPGVVLAVLLAVLLSVGSAPASAAEALADEIDFNEQVRPILSDRCFFCHGPDEANRKAKLRLDTYEGATRLRDGSAAIVPGKVDESELHRRIHSADPEEVMPPPQSKLTLTESERLILDRWINLGANYKTHWSFLSPVLPDIPVTRQHQDLVRNPIDALVFSRLENLNLHAQAEASRERLIRRLTFDLTGLPPTLEQIDAFQNDDSPDAYEKLVDRLLASPRFGERLAVDWMDTARYADSYGFQVDRDRSVWRWRDWVIGAFNENLTYDKFITWQVAGDLLPNPTDEQILATTFNRLHQQKTEGGSIEEEFRVEYVADRTHTFGTAFLGLTMECSRCHDHKYDPITQKDYYSLFAFFNNINEAGLYAYFGNATPTPTLLLADDAKKQAIAAAASKIELAEKTIRNIPAEKFSRDAFARWLAHRPGEPVISGEQAHLSFDELDKDGKLANQADPEKSAQLHGNNQLVGEGKSGQCVQLTGDDPVTLPGIGAFTRNDPFTISLWLNTPEVKERAVIFHRSRAWTDSGSEGYQLLIEEGKLSASMIHFWPGDAIGIRTKSPVEPGKWTHVAMSYDGSSRAAGLKIFIDGELTETEIVQDYLVKSTTGTPPNQIAIGERFRDVGFKDGRVDEFRVFDRALTILEAAHLHDSSSLTGALSRPVEELSREDQQSLYAYYLSNFNETFRNGQASLQRARADLATLNDGLEEIMVMKEQPGPATAFILARGNYAERREPVVAAPPAFLPPLPEEAPRNRLGLARWLVDPAHPLTARVAANRFWQMFFGSGLVGTPEDFGSQGRPPTHPKLLDWLALEFMRLNWDVKALCKTIVMSHTYRQDSRADGRLLEADPANETLARGPLHRLSAEMLRDNALHVSRLLVDRIGGPSARPYEVAVSFKPVPHDKGEGLYRRSLYTYWKQTGPAPSMMALDAAKRDVCSVKREPTASPLQALVLLNDPQFVEAARVLAGNLMSDLPGQPDRQIARAFRMLTSRSPRAAESGILEKMRQEQLAYFQPRPEDAKKLLETGESAVDENHPIPEFAALTVVVSALMNFDECVMKR